MSVVHLILYLHHGPPLFLDNDERCADAESTFYGIPTWLSNYKEKVHRWKYSRHTRRVFSIDSHKNIFSNKPGVSCHIPCDFMVSVTSPRF